MSETRMRRQLRLLRSPKSRGCQPHKKEPKIGKGAYLMVSRARTASILLIVTFGADLLYRGFAPSLSRGRQQKAYKLDRRLVLGHRGEDARDQSDDYMADVVMHKFQDKGEAIEADMNKPDIAQQPPRERDYKMVLLSDQNTTSHTWGWGETQQTLQFCEQKDFYDKGKLPDISVVICFHEGEKISNLLFTIHSIVQRTPAHLLREIVLVDDSSRKDDFQQVLEIYSKSVFHGKIRIHRSDEKLGLIRARLKGIRMSYGEVVVIMDSHVEVQKGWIEPMLYEIKSNRMTMAASYLDWLELSDGGQWVYRHGGTVWKSYFDWAMVFGWQMMSDDAIAARKDLAEPIPSPVIIGTIFAIDRDFFEEVGAFDDGMQLWGGENIDLPIRVWLFGGRVVNIPCSRVAHMEIPGTRDYRLQAAYKERVATNYKRFAEVWLGDYKKYFNMYFPEAQGYDAGSLVDRKRLKSSCDRTFGWFLKNVYPELGLPDQDGFAWGELKNQGSHYCLGTGGGMVASMGKCDGSPHDQLFYWAKDSLQLRFPLHIFNTAVDVNIGHDQPELSLHQEEYMAHYAMPNKPCSKWIHWRNGPMYETNSKLCLEAVGNGVASLRTCDLRLKTSQRWTFQYYTDAYRNMTSSNHSAQFRAVRQIFDSVRLKVDAAPLDQEKMNTSAVRLPMFGATVHYGSSTSQSTQQDNHHSWRTTRTRFKMNEYIKR